MMTVGKHRVKSHMSMDYDFTGIRLINGSLTPVDWNLSIDLVAIDKKGSSDSDYNANLAYQKLFFWLETNLPNIIMVDVTNEEDLYLANLSSNIMLYCPCEPYDDVIVQLIHSKLSTLADGNLLVGEIRIKASDMTVRYAYDATEIGYTLPDSTKEYYVEGKTRDSIPWWYRNDGFSFEFVRPETDVPDEELYKDIVDPLEEFDKIISDMADHVFGVTREPARIVQIEKWKPKKV